MNVAIRPESADDVDRTFAVVESAFRDRLEADLVNALRRSASPQISLIAEAPGAAVVGHVFFSPITIESDRPAPPAAQLSPVAVLPDYQRQGVGTKLIRAGLSRCAATGWSAVFLVGNPGPHDPYLQVLELSPGALSGVRGRIRFHPAFAEVGAE